MVAATGDLPARRVWLFSAPVDLLVFGVPALVALVLTAASPVLAGPGDEAPGWLWLMGIVLVDVAHVWGTGFRVYFDADERARRPFLYMGTPLAAWLAGVALYAMGGAALFWRALASAAVFHFVRQQAGWVKLYRHRDGTHHAIDVWIDTAAIYAATLYPLLYWHTHLPRRFAWMMPHDFVALPAALEPWVRVFYAAALAAYAARACQRAARGHGYAGKDLVVLTTALCWYVGIVATNSDYAFTVTNVFIHGVPYFALVYAFGCHRARATQGRGVWAMFRRGPYAMLGVLWACAICEEFLWDNMVWRDSVHASLFERLHIVLVPLLAVPQLTHYVLDGFVWRRAHNPILSGFFRSTT